MISDDSRAEFERVGRIHVERCLDKSLYNETKQKEAYDWLDEKDHGHERELAREQISIAREAKDAAVAAANAALVQARTAKHALIIAAIALIISIASPLYSLISYLLSKWPWLAFWAS